MNVLFNITSSKKAQLEFLIYIFNLNSNKKTLTFIPLSHFRSFSNLINYILIGMKRHLSKKLKSFFNFILRNFNEPGQKYIFLLLKISKLQ